VKAKQFVLTFRDYLITSDQTMPNTPYMPATAPLPGESGAGDETAGSALFAAAPQVPPASTLHPNGPDDSEEWVLKHIDVAHIQPIIEAMDEDGSGFISVQEANKFALRRPPGMRSVALRCRMNVSLAYKFVLMQTFALDCVLGFW
jgi:hypothetical protein